MNPKVQGRVRTEYNLDEAMPDIRESSTVVLRVANAVLKPANVVLRAAHGVRIVAWF